MIILEKLRFIFCKKNQKAFSAFKSFKVRVKNETKRFIKTLSIDRGGEYCSKAFHIFCEQGI